MEIPFTKPYIHDEALKNIDDVLKSGHIHSNGYFTKQCRMLLEGHLLDSKRVFITQSCTSALEMCAILADIEDGDEVIMPSFAFTTTANAFVLQGGTPVFVDIRRDTLNIDETKIEEAITAKTRAIVVVHYAGVSCEMDTILEIAKRHNLLVIEDAAQAWKSFYKGRPLGSIGDLGTFSFHATKNVHCGEGGALVINNSKFVERAGDVWFCGTDILRSPGSYEWVDKGSSYMPSEITTALLYSQLKHMGIDLYNRVVAWNRYYKALIEVFEIEIPVIPEQCIYNAHIFWILVDQAKRDGIIKELAKRGIKATAHYYPLHQSKYGKKFYAYLPVTNTIVNRLIRLPLYNDITKEEVEYVITNTVEVINEKT